MARRLDSPVVGTCVVCSRYGLLDPPFGVVVVSHTSASLQQGRMFLFIGIVMALVQGEWQPFYMLHYISI